MYGSGRPSLPNVHRLVDGANGVAHHLAQTLNLAVSPALMRHSARTLARAAGTGWSSSGGDSTFKYDLGQRRPRRAQSTVSCSQRDADGTLRHFTPRIPRMAPDPTSASAASTCWLHLALQWTLPARRGNWYTSLDYGTKVQAASSRLISNARSIIRPSGRCLCSIAGSTTPHPAIPRRQPSLSEKGCRRLAQKAFAVLLPHEPR